MNARRDIGWIDQWVLAHSKTLTPQLKSEQARYGVSTEYLVGYIYVDQQAGQSLDVLSYCTLEGDKITLTRGPRADNARLMLRYGVFDIMEITPLTDAQRQALRLPKVPEWLQHYQGENQPALEKMRSLEILDSLRAPGFPDDIQFFIPPPQQGMQIEYLWGRLLGQAKSDVFVVQLLNQPNQDYGGIRIGDLLAVQVVKLKDGVGSVCVGKIKPP